MNTLEADEVSLLDDTAYYDARKKSAQSTLPIYTYILESYMKKIYFAHADYFVVSSSRLTSSASKVSKNNCRPLIDVIFSDANSHLFYW